MKRPARLRAAADFAAVRAHGRAVHSAALTLSWVGTTQAHNRFGFVVGKRVGNAVTRNLVKRRLRAIMETRHAQIVHSHDIVVIAHPSAAQSAFTALERDIDQLLRRARLAPRPAEQSSRQDAPVPPPAPPSLSVSE